MKRTNALAFVSAALLTVVIGVLLGTGGASFSAIAVPLPTPTYPTTSTPSASTTPLPTQGPTIEFWLRAVAEDITANSAKIRITGHASVPISGVITVKVNGETKSITITNKGEIAADVSFSGLQPKTRYPIELGFACSTPGLHEILSVGQNVAGFFDTKGQTFTVYFYGMGGYFLDTTTGKYTLPNYSVKREVGDLIGSGYVERPSEPGRSFTFAGWYDNPYGQGAPLAGSARMPSNDVYLYAHWIVTYQTPTPTPTPSTTPTPTPSFTPTPYPTSTG